MSKPQLHHVIHLFSRGLRTASQGCPVRLKPACKWSRLSGLLTKATGRRLLPSPTACTAFLSPKAVLNRGDFWKGSWYLPSLQTPTEKQQRKPLLWKQRETSNQAAQPHPWKLPLLWLISLVVQWGRPHSSICGHKTAPYTLLPGQRQQCPPLCHAHEDVFDSPVPHSYLT